MAFDTAKLLADLRTCMLPMELNPDELEVLPDDQHVFFSMLMDHCVKSGFHLEILTMPCKAYDRFGEEMFDEKNVLVEVRVQRLRILRGMGKTLRDAMDDLHTPPVSATS
jgi:hypothetical protein